MPCALKRKSAEGWGGGVGVGTRCGGGEGCGRAHPEAYSTFQHPIGAGVEVFRPFWGHGARRGREGHPAWSERLRLTPRLETMNKRQRRPGSAQPQHALAAVAQRLDQPALAPAPARAPGHARDSTGWRRKNDSGGEQQRAGCGAARDPREREGGGGRKRGGRGQRGETDGLSGGAIQGPHPAARLVRWGV